jgi:hypothetical protein
MANQILQFFSDLFNKNRPQMIYQALPLENVDRQDGYVKLVEGKHYVQLYLAEMYLKTQTQFMVNWFPLVQSLARFQFGADAIDVPNVADSSRIGAQKYGAGDVIARNYEMTPLIPFNSGSIQLSAALIGAQGDNLLKDFISTLSDFSKLLAVPQFSTALGLAGPLVTGLQNLMNGPGKLHLGLNDTFGVNSQGGYYAAIRATEQEVDIKRLRVQNNQLRIVNGRESVPFDLYDYMLFRLDVKVERNDWDKLGRIQEPLSLAHQAYGESNPELSEAYYRKAQIAVREAPELTTADRTRVSLLLKQDYKQLKEDLNFAGLLPNEINLNQFMKYAISVDEAMEKGEPAFSDLVIAEGN